MDFETNVKLNIYETIAREARVPSALEVAQALDTSLEDVSSAFETLNQKRLLVPEPGDPLRIRMAPPFSGVETPFEVRAGGKIYYANCIWDAFGIPAALHTDAVMLASDGFAGDPITLEIRDGLPVPRTCFMHFAVPAARWWEDIIYT